MKRSVSLKDIAKQLGVSTALVSYVLNGKEKEARVGKEIATEIRRVAKELNYQPNLIARSLKFGSTKTIGLIVADISNPFFSNLARIIENEAKEHGYTVIFGSSDEDKNKFVTVTNALLTRQVDGLIITPVEGSESQIINLQERKIPFVLIDRYYPTIKTNTVVINNYQSTYDATNHLINNGYDRIGMIAYHSSVEHMKERIRGYTEAIKDNKLQNLNYKNLCEVKYNNVNDEIEKIVHKLIFENKVNALFFATVSIAIKSLHIINKYNIHVPEKLALLSFDESDVFDFFNPPVSYIKQNLEEIGKNAVQIVLKNIITDSTGNAFKEIKTEFIARESTKKVDNNFVVS